MKVIDLFAGCGGLSLGFQNAGYKIIAAYDYWDAAVKVYRQNFQHPIYPYDLRASKMYLSEFKNLNPELIIGGPPCQDFSSAGKRNENLGRGDLTICFANIITEVMPKMFVMENVERFTKTNKYIIAKNIFIKAGYGLTETVLDASLCGVPQKRKRFFWIGIHNQQNNKFLPYLENNLNNQPMTVRDYLGEILGIEYYYRHPRSYKRRAVFSIDEPSPTVRGVNRPIPKTYQSHPRDAAPISSQIRPLTTRERSYIQTFPQDFIFQGSKTDLEQMIGNAVPVKLAEYVAKCILQCLNHIPLQSRSESRTVQLSLFSIKKV